MNTTIVHRDTFLSFTPNGSGIEVKTFRGYDIEAVQQMATDTARKLYRLKLSEGFVPATAANVEHTFTASMLAQGRV
jgi:hypothetical protein